MAGSGRRLALRATLALAVATVGVSSTALVSLAAASPFNLAVQVGYRNTLKIGQWMPVSVDVTNNGPDFEGSLEIQGTSSSGGPPIGAAVYEAPASLASGATKHFRTYVSQDFPGPVQVRLVQGGHVVASLETTAANTFSGLMVGVLSDQASTLDSLGSLRAGGSSPLVVHLASSDLSDSPQILRAFDVLAIDDFATDSLTAGQKTALADYVRQGGALLLGTGGSWHKTLAGLPAAMVPMRVDGTTLLDGATALGGASGVEVATGALNPGAVAWLTEGTRPLLVEAAVGKGIVTMATFDWNQDAVATWSGVTAIQRQALVRGTYGNLGNPGATSPVMTKFGVGGSASLATKGGTLAQALGNLPALDLPPWWLIGGLVFGYVLLVGPINYFVLRGIGRRALAWVTVPTIAVVASAGAYGTSVVTKGTSVLANEVTVIHVQNGVDRAYVEEYTGIMAPTRGDYQVGIGHNRVLVSPIYYYYGNVSDANLAPVRVNTVSSDVTLPAMTAFTLRAFAGEGMISGPPRLAGQAQMVGGQLTGSVTNNSPLEFTDGVVVSGNSYQKLGRLEPGKSLPFTLQPSSSTFPGPAIGVNIYPSNFQFNSAPPNYPSDAEREAETRSAVLSTLVPNAFGGLPATTQPIVVLWTRQTFQSVTVNGAHPHEYVETAVVLTLPFQQVGAGALPSGVVQGRIVDMDADTSQAGPPGLVYAQKGSITYSFSPTLAPGTRLTSASISNVNPFGAKGVIGPTGAAATIKAQAWDWSSSDWIDLSYQDTGSTSVPDAAVNPTTGEVRLRLSSDGQFATGWLSLTGTVNPI